MPPSEFSRIRLHLITARARYMSQTARRRKRSARCGKSLRELSAASFRSSLLHVVLPEIGKPQMQWSSESRIALISRKSEWDNDLRTQAAKPSDAARACLQSNFRPRVQRKKIILKIVEIVFSKRLSAVMASPGRWMVTTRLSFA